MATVWTVSRHDTVIGTIVVDDMDQPWFHGVFEPTAEFIAFQGRFDEELRLIEQILVDQTDDSGAVSAWEAIQESLRDDGLCLRKPDGAAVAEFILHVADGRAWFRYSDEPFWRDAPEQAVIPS